MSSLIFFDINGTLVRRDERTDISLSRAVDQCLEVKGAMKGVDTSARSDRDVFMEVVRRFHRPFTESLWKKFMGIYREELEAFSHTDIWRENPGAVGCVRFLSDRGIPLSLITGELRVGARYKLEKLGIWTCFPAGGFGEDGLERLEIARAALKQAEKYYRQSFNRIWVIGDTVLDIRTARELKGVSIAVTMGSHSRSRLAAETPDYLVNNFTEIRALFD